MKCNGDTTRKENYKHDPDEHRCKYPSKTLANRTEEHGKRTTHCEYVGFIPGNQEGSNIRK